MRSCLRHAGKAFNKSPPPDVSIPLFLCPTLLRIPLVAPPYHVEATPQSKTFSTFRPRQQQTAASISACAAHESPTIALAPTKLPRACPGCGAPTQVFDKSEAGYYNIDRKRVQQYLDHDPSSEAETRKEQEKEDNVYTKALTNADPALLDNLGMSKEALHAPKRVEQDAPQIPLCERCHNLVHHRVATPIHHPSVESIQQTIWESPHQRNHIYHVIDAVDFPLSLVPNLQSSLRIPKLRTQNRRAKHKGWVANDRVAQVSFIITRADLLAPKKEQVDRLMPYMQEVLRDALGRQNQNARLGNVRMVSAKRGWWTKQVKEEIWDRGGGGWMVGKVNVGKSNLFENVFPKGRGADYQDIGKMRSAAEREAMLTNAKSIEDIAQVQQQLAKEDAEIERRQNEAKNVFQEQANQEDVQEGEEEDYDPDSLLPPRQPYTAYPILPIASSLPGTTASPIRIPFGRNRGELIDLPGLARTTPGLETFVQPAEHDSLVMQHRMNADRFVLKPGQSLILGGGLIRITPTTEDLIFLVYPFVPIHPHLTRTDKAIDYQAQTSDRTLPSILAPNAGQKMKSAGRFKLKWDVTKKVSGPLTSPVAAKIKPENLPFRVWSTDILIEGVGWVEISAQVRRPPGWKPVGMVKKNPNHLKERNEALARQRRADKHSYYDALSAMEDVEDLDGDERFWQEDYPEVEVFSPLGKYIGARKPMCASTTSGPKQVSSRERRARPRRSIASVKRQRKPMEK